jgi:ribosomal protein S18 acetylase RimI-like enzyme
VSSDIKLKKIVDFSDASVFDKVSSIHEKTIQSGFIIKLGRSFLKSLYREIVKSNSSFLIVAYEGSEIIGFIACSENTSKLYKDYIIHNTIRIIPIIFRKLFNIATIKKIIEVLIYPNKSKRIGINPDAEILNFCVLDSCQGKGVGKLLYTEMMDEFKTLSVKEIKIVTGEEQKSAHKFYEKMNAKLATEIAIHKGVMSRIYIASVPSEL